MFSTNLKGPLVTLAVTAGLLAVAGPASAGNAAGAITYNGHAGLGAARLNSSGDELARVGFTALPELDANANAFFRPEVGDEVLAYINYEPDVYW